MLWRAEAGLAIADIRYEEARQASGEGFLSLLLEDTPRAADVLSVLRWIDSRPRTALELYQRLAKKTGLLAVWHAFYEAALQDPARRALARRLPPPDPHALSRKPPRGGGASFPDRLAAYQASTGGQEDDYAFLLQEALQVIPRVESSSDVADYYEAMSPLYRGRRFRQRWARFRRWALSQGPPIPVAAAPAPRKGDGSLVSLPEAVAHAVVTLSRDIPAVQLGRATWADLDWSDARPLGARGRWLPAPRVLYLSADQEAAVAALRAWAFDHGRVEETLSVPFVPIRPGAEIGLTPAAIRFLLRAAHRGQLVEALRPPIRWTPE
jgi:hypothetical protein